VLNVRPQSSVLFAAHEVAAHVEHLQRCEADAFEAERGGFDDTAQRCPAVRPPPSSSDRSRSRRVHFRRGTADDVETAWSAVTAVTAFVCTRRRAADEVLHGHRSQGRNPYLVPVTTEKLRSGAGDAVNL
jgi:hypothetical protein